MRSYMESSPTNIGGGILFPSPYISNYTSLYIPYLAHSIVTLTNTVDNTILQNYTTNKTITTINSPYRTMISGMNFDQIAAETNSASVWSGVLILVIGFCFLPATFVSTLVKVF